MEEQTETMEEQIKKIKEAIGTLSIRLDRVETMAQTDLTHIREKIDEFIRRTNYIQ